MQTKKFDGWVIPEHEGHLPVWMQANNDRRLGRLTYQAHKYDAAMAHVTNKKRAIDIGGHLGMWSFLMAHDFKEVIAFEPVALHRHCFEQNVTHDHVKLMPFALGKESSTVALKTWTADSTGDTGIDETAAFGTVQMVTLDELCIGQVGLIKIDCEGYEQNVVMGAAETITRCKPIVIVEQKGTMSARYGIDLLGAVTFLESLGMKRISCISGDWIMGW